MKLRLGVDVGGTKIEGALVSENGVAVKRLRVPTNSSSGRKAVLDNILFVIKSLDNSTVKSVGLGIAGVIDKNGFLQESPNIQCLEGLNVSKELEKLLGKPVFQENDANCFALAEQRFGAAKGCKDVVGLIIGTGIGAGLIFNGEIYRGVDGCAGEVGRMVIDSSSNLTFEDLCSGHGIVRRYKALGGKMKNPNPRNIFSSKEKAAKIAVNDTYKYLGIGIANLLNILDPEIIVLGGGVSNLSFYQKLRVEVKKHSINSKNVILVKNKLGDSSGVIGAAFLRG
ncbi:MAG: ROK family protein [Nanoarchaeota archaeon]|nr:ROK family protein [Nanoarchaeota archaeon]MBU1269682.1 ROK family protein [Nanoarchaeota archaeon]MBU1604104.1 ROK family protein [Nanoarchaeota archaeon]MBU2443604.1 ROK family protein [Nanoarchaeota archaeon]